MEYQTTKARMETTKFLKTAESEADAHQTMSTTTNDTTEARGLVLCAVIKASSKYAYQGRYTGKPVAMRVTFLEPGEYAFHLENGNRYRREDLTFYVEDTTGKLIKLR
jgi:uncharacterized protein (DUF2141 family)